MQALGQSLEGGVDGAGDGPGRGGGSPTEDRRPSHALAIQDGSWPSSGLAYALAIYDTLSQPDEARARSTTVDLEGDVGLVGGVPLKALGARPS